MCYLALYTLTGTAFCSGDKEMGSGFGEKSTHGLFLQPCRVENKRVSFSMLLGVGVTTGALYRSMNDQQEAFIFHLLILLAYCFNCECEYTLFPHPLFVTWFFDK